MEISGYYKTGKYLTNFEKNEKKFSPCLTQANRWSLCLRAIQGTKSIVIYAICVKCVLLLKGFFGNIIQKTFSGKIMDCNLISVIGIWPL